MSIFSKIERNIYSPVNGKQISLNDVPDEMFSKEMLGPTIAFDFNDNAIYAPADGKVTMLTNTKHAIGIQTKFGVEVLIHIGINTVELNGEGFSTCVKENQTVKKGEKLIIFDKKSIEGKGLLYAYYFNYYKYQ